MREVVVTSDLTLDGTEMRDTRLVVVASHVTIDGKGATLIGPGTPGNPESLETAGVGITARGCHNVTLKNIKARGFATGLVLTDCRGWLVEDCDFSNNYHNPQHGWGELPARGGIVLVNVSESVFRNNRANNVWDALNMTDCEDNEFSDNDFSHCSNVCAKLWTSSRNRFVRNNLSYGLRIDRSIGEVHARDSTGVLIESASNDNYWYQNDITYGGDGVFIRVLNGWLSTGNVFIENDTSYANNNCVECWSPGNVFIRNKANHGSYGFWMGGSDRSVIIGNECAFNGMPDEHQNAPVSKEMGFAGIIFAGGTGTHTIVEGNWCHHNGAGIVIQGDVASRGARWNIHHWIIQNNRLEDNRRAMWLELADWVFIGPNECRGNAEENYIHEVTRLVRGVPSDDITVAPVARLEGPTNASVGHPVVFDASSSYDPQEKPLTFQWDIDGKTFEQSAVTLAFSEPGFHRVGLTVSNGTFAGLASLDVLAVDDSAGETGTEFEAGKWSAEANGVPSDIVRFSNCTDALVGKYSLHFAPETYAGGEIAVTYPKTRDAAWDLSGKTKLVFWMKLINPNIPIENAVNGHVTIDLRGDDGDIRFVAKNYNAFFHGSYNEARSNWRFVEVPIRGESADWVCETIGEPSPGRIHAIRLSVTSAGDKPFRVWLDGLRFE